MAWEENSRICLHMQLIAILSRIGVHYYSFSLKKSEFLNKLPHFAYKQIIFQGVHLSQVHQPSKKCTNRATIVFKSLFMRKICHISQQACNALSGSGLTAGR